MLQLPKFTWSFWMQHVVFVKTECTAYVKTKKRVCKVRNPLWKKCGTDAGGKISESCRGGVVTQMRRVAVCVGRK